MKLLSCLAGTVLWFAACGQGVEDGGGDDAGYHGMQCAWDERGVAGVTLSQDIASETIPVLHWGTGLDLVVEGDVRCYLGGDFASAPLVVPVATSTEPPRMSGEVSLVLPSGGSYCCQFEGRGMRSIALFSNRLPVRR
jgi:hypothetical protein